jgi:hypothetical protein
LHKPKGEFAVIRKLLTALALTSSFLAPTDARADTWGCEVLLCLSNPAGPMAVSQCVPPITRLYKAIFKWRPDPFPTCMMSNGADSSSKGNYAYVAPPSYYDACPAGTTALDAGQAGAVGSNAQVMGAVTVGIGDGSGVSPSTGQDSAPMPAKTCVGTLTGRAYFSTGGGDDRTDTLVNTYDRIVYVNPANTTFNINVVINNSLYRNIRPAF